MNYTIKHFVKGHCTSSDSFPGFGLETVTRQALRAVESGHTDRAEVLDDEGSLVAQFPPLQGQAAELT